MPGWQSGQLHLTVNQTLRLRWFESITRHVKETGKDLPADIDGILKEFTENIIDEQEAWERLLEVGCTAKGAQRHIDRCKLES